MVVGGKDLGTTLRRSKVGRSSSIIRDGCLSGLLTLVLKESKWRPWDPYGSGPNFRTVNKTLKVLPPAFRESCKDHLGLKQGIGPSSRSSKVSGIPVTISTPVCHSGEKTRGP